ncbi:helix-turn-helix domain-containing protein [Nocardioides solisilvae]|uniref:helix-turn-helix domain-containing protein n=1 Tax=Nocardioides solisilvae TaxID=1542435 RepID=UPI000D7402B3|nr:AraC family transcriptional regulator [Nocardioides solisilvae]
MSLAGHPAARADGPGVEEFGHGLGPPTGVLVLRYPRSWGVPRFPETRDDQRHQLFWSPDGVLAVRLGAQVAHVPPDRAFWARRGTTLEVSGCDSQTVHVVCVRQAPAALTRLPAALVAFGQEAAHAVRALCRTDLAEVDALDLRDRLLADLGDPHAVEHAAAGLGHARRVAAALLSDPGDPTELAAWAERLHLSPKTLQRDFLREYGLPWSAWRTRTRLEASRALLGLLPVGQVGHRVGYASASAYVSAFRREYGVTPARWAARRGPQEGRQRG